MAMFFIHHTYKSIRVITKMIDLNIIRHRVSYVFKFFMLSVNN